ncbi:MAG: HlyD family secretion protein [Parabacteroides sp.]|nr:HlyD family secretion protein [Parabacteroides sp.]
MRQEKRQKKTLMWTVIVATIILVATVITLLVKNNHYESTEDAQIDGNIVPLKTSIAGYVKEIRFSDNRFVKKGDTLVVLDNDYLLTQVKIAEATLENAKASLETSKLKSFAGLANIVTYENKAKSGQQSVLLAKADLDNAQKNYDRTIKLLAIKGTTQMQVDEETNKLQVAKANYQKALNEQKASISSIGFQKANFKSDRAQISVAASLIKQKESELQLAKENLDHTYISAPFSGIITKRAVNKGEYLSVGQNICALIDNQNIWVTANFKETQLKNMRIGKKVRISVPAIPNIKFKGYVDSFTNATGAKFSLIPPDNASGNFTKVVQRVPVKIKLTDIDSAIKIRLYPGLSCNVRVNTK